MIVPGPEARVLPMILTRDDALAAAREAVAAASAVCRAVASRRVAIRTLAKDDQSPVTVADFASQAVATRVLGRRLGALTLVAEEEGEVLRTARPAYQQAVVEAVRVAWADATLDDVLGALAPLRDPGAHGFWTLDPVDGTKGFLRGQQYCVSLAWILDGAPVVGVLGCPNLPRDPRQPVDRADPVGSSYFATRGGGAQAATGTAGDAPGERIHVAAREGALVLAAPLEEGHADREGDGTHWPPPWAPWCPPCASTASASTRWWRAGRRTSTCVCPGTRATCSASGTTPRGRWWRRRPGPA